MSRWVPYTRIFHPTISSGPLFQLQIQVRGRRVRNQPTPSLRARNPIPSLRTSFGKTGCCRKARTSSGIPPRAPNRRITILQVLSLPLSLSLVNERIAAGLIPFLKTHLNKSHAAGNTCRAVLCYDRAVLVTREVWDAGWGCGFASPFVSARDNT